MWVTEGLADGIRVYVNSYPNAYNETTYVVDTIHLTRDAALKWFLTLGELFPRAEIRIEAD